MYSITISQKSNSHPEWQIIMHTEVAEEDLVYPHTMDIIVNKRPGGRQTRIEVRKVS